MPPRIPARTREELIAAMRTFDSTARDGYNFRQNKFVVCFEGHAYPPKAIIAIATGLSVREFSGGQESNGYLQKRGFQIAANAK